MTRNKILTTIFFLTVFLSLNGQEDRFKEFAEAHKDRAFCFYPSTLRMLNIGDQQEFNNLVNNVEKLLVYKLDSISRADKLYSNMIEDYKSEGFEEYVKIVGGGNDMLILGSPAGAEKEFVSIVINDEISLAIFLRGEVGWEEIPKIIRSFQSGDFINVLDFNLAEFD